MAEEAGQQPPGEQKRQRRMSANLLTMMSKDVMLHTLGQMNVKDAFTWCNSHPSQVALCHNSGLWKSWLEGDWPPGSMRYGETYETAYRRLFHRKQLRRNGAVARRANVYRVPYLWRADVSETDNLKLALYKYHIKDEVQLLDPRMDFLRTSSVIEMVRHLRRVVPARVVLSAALQSPALQVALDAGVEALVVGERHGLVIFFVLGGDNEIYVPIGLSVPIAADNFQCSHIEAITALASVVPVLR